MRLADISAVSRLSFVLLVSAVVAGCTHHPLENGFFDPSEVGRYKKEPLAVPILSSLDPANEIPNDEFAAATDVQPADLQADAIDYAIGPNDLLSISITDLVGPGVETLKTARVTESGNISLPLLGQIKAEGMSESQLEQAIAEAYRKANIIQNATVTVVIAEARARTFSILGQVMRPGQYQILQTDFRMLDALVLAGDVQQPTLEYLYVVRREKKNGSAGPSGAAPTGATPTAPASQPGDILAPRSDAGNDLRWSVLLQTSGGPATAAKPTTRSAPGAMTAEDRYGIVDGRPVPVAPAPAEKPAAPVEQPTAPAAPAEKPASEGFEFNNPMGPGSVRVIRVPYQELKNGDLKYNIVVRPQDMIMVPTPGYGNYWVAGHVQRTGVYSLTGQKITLKQAIDGAGGFDALAIPARTEVIRRIGKDKEVFCVVDMDKVFAGQQPDIFLKPYDQVRVGTAFWAPFVAAVRNGFRITYGFGFLYDRNYAPQQPYNN